MSGTKITPTFFLRGLDPNKVLSDYNSGLFRRQPVTKSKIKISQNTTILARTYGTSNHDPIFSVKDRNNSVIVIATSGHNDFELFSRTGVITTTPGRCDFCKCDVTNPFPGYPIGYQETTVLINDSRDVKDARYRVTYVFWMETAKKFCDAECALAFVNINLDRSSQYRDTTLRNSESMLKFLYTLMYPNFGPLRPAQDPSLLQENGGSLTREEWKDIRHIYIRSDRILMIPAKVEYIQQNFQTPATAIDFTANTHSV